MTETGDENSVSFASPEEEIEYWKEKAMEYRAKYSETDYPPSQGLDHSDEFIIV